MKPMQCLKYWVIGSVFVFAAVHSLSAEVRHYTIEPGGQYTFLPSPESAGIGGCSPSEYECVFGIDGSLGVMVDAGIATLLDINLSLIGNEQVQQDAPIPLVTSQGVADWLEDRSLARLPTAGPFDIFADETYPDFQLIDSLLGTISLSGGYDHRPVDGDGVLFAMDAVIVPEPSAIVLWALGLMVASTWRFRPYRRFRP